VILVAAGNPLGITTLDDLQGRTTAQSSTSNWAEVARDAGADVETVEDFSQAADLLAQGRVDAIVNDNLAILDYLATTGTDAVEIAGDADADVSAQALAFRRDDPADTALRDQADVALAAMAEDGTLASISEDYFGTDVSIEGGAQVDELEGSDDRSTWAVVRDAAGPMALAALKGTIPLTAVSFLVGLVLALATALARMSSITPLSWIARIYISIIRGTPLLVQLLIVFFGLPQIGIDLPSFTAACLALSLNVGGYAAEIIRASILSVPRGQLEAATTIGMGYGTAMRRIILPQASRIAVPPLSNTLLSLVKDTSLVSVVLVTEILRVARDAAGLTFQYLPLYTLAAFYFWVICFLLSLVQQRLEHRLEGYAA
jgi:cystine transport system permease protein